MDTDNILHNVRVAKPCTASWDKMAGDERMRHCTDCRLDVYNFSNMTGNEIATLLHKNEGRVCGRFYRRSDGTIITGDCPLGEATTRNSHLPLVAVGVLIFATIGAAITRISKHEASPVSTTFEPARKKARDWPIVGEIVDSLFPRPQVVVGMIAPCPPPSSGPSKGP